MCRGSGQNLEDARRAGDFVPGVAEAATGAFTVPRAPQVLYLILNGECGATHADGFGSVTLAVVDHGAIVARTILGGGSSIDGVFDLDGDGRNEFVVTSGFTNQGSTTESASIMRFDGARLVTIASFGEVSESSCGSPFGAKTESISFVRALVRQGMPPEFKVEKTSRPCP
jgi:hypothetical protein